MVKLLEIFWGLTRLPAPCGMVESEPVFIRHILQDGTGIFFYQTEFLCNTTVKKETCFCSLFFSLEAFSPTKFEPISLPYTTIMHIIRTAHLKTLS